VIDGERRRRENDMGSVHAQAVVGEDALECAELTARAHPQAHQRVRARRWVLASGVWLGGAALAACGSPSEQPAQQPGGPIRAEAGTLQWFLWEGAPANVAAAKSVADSFHQHQSTVKVEPVIPAGSGTYYEKITPLLAGGQQVDVIGSSSVWVPDIAEVGMPRALDDFVSRDKSFKLGDYAKGVVDAATWKGKLFMLTVYANFAVTYYNKTMFDRAGVKYPDDTWTRETALEAARKMTQRTGNADTDVFGMDFPRDMNQLLPVFWNNGGDIFDRVEAPTKTTMSSPAALDAFTWLCDLVTRHKVAPGEGGTAVPGFETGSVGFLSQGLHRLPAVKPNAQFPWDIAVIPKGKNNARDNYAGTLFYGMADATKLPDASWTFLKHLCGLPGQRAWLGLEAGAPATKLLEKDYVALPAPPANRKIVIDGLANLRAMPKSPKITQIRVPIIEAVFKDAFSGKISPAEAARQIDDRAAAVLSAR
jgi:multiple sugar transport system substrate-binding protein